MTNERTKHEASILCCKLWSNLLSLIFSKEKKWFSKQCIKCYECTQIGDCRHLNSTIAANQFGRAMKVMIIESVLHSLWFLFHNFTRLHKQWESNLIESVPSKFTFVHHSTKFGIKSLTFRSENHQPECRVTQFISLEKRSVRFNFSIVTLNWFSFCCNPILFFVSFC